MIANLLNTLVGLGLAYAAIFPSTLTASRDRFGLIAAVVLIILALWARRSDLSTWQSTTTITAGILLAMLIIANQLIQVSDVLMFWGVLWAGLISATVSLWAALYRTPSNGKCRRMIAQPLRMPCQQLTWINEISTDRRLLCLLHNRGHGRWNRRPMMLLIRSSRICVAFSMRSTIPSWVSESSRPSFDLSRAMDRCRHRRRDDDDGAVLSLCGHHAPPSRACASRAFQRSTVRPGAAGVRSAVVLRPAGRERVRGSRLEFSLAGSR